VPEPLLTIEESLALLRENASRLAALTVGVKHSQLHAAPEIGEWSPNEILAHVRACCDVWGGVAESVRRVGQVQRTLTRD
jgi:hypothetical protein